MLCDLLLCDGCHSDQGGRETKSSADAGKQKAAAVVTNRGRVKAFNATLNKNYLVVLVTVSLSVLYIDSILAVLSCFWEATIANICQAMTHRLWAADFHLPRPSTNQRMDVNQDLREDSGRKPSIF